MARNKLPYLEYLTIVNNAGIKHHKLDDKTDIKDWIILGYMHKLENSSKAKKIVVDNRGGNYTWLHLPTMVNALPMLKLADKSALSKRIKKLENKGLVKTYRSRDNTLYFMSTELLKNIITFDCKRFVHEPVQKQPRKIVMEDGRIATEVIENKEKSKTPLLTNPTSSVDTGVDRPVDTGVDRPIAHTATAQQHKIQQIQMQQGESSKERKNASHSLPSSLEKNTEISAEYPVLNSESFSPPTPQPDENIFISKVEHKPQKNLKKGEGADIVNWLAGHVRERFSIAVPVFNYKHYRKVVETLMDTLGGEEETKKFLKWCIDRWDTLKEDRDFWFLQEHPVPIAVFNQRFLEIAVAKYRKPNLYVVNKEVKFI